MITAIVEMKIPAGTGRAELMRAFEASAPNYRGLAGLVRKYYLYDEDRGIAGGAYLWESRAAADAVYNEAWKKSIVERYGAPPSIRYYETPVIVDNLAQAILGDAAE